MSSLIFITAALLCLWASSANGQLLVQLPHGQLRGRDHGTYYTFESVPYADPPVGDLRFEAPQPFSGVWNETFDASRPADECLQWSHFVVQPNKLTGSEDCLTVSIFKPKNASRSSFPVVAKIFGGAWSFGGSVEDGAREFMDSGNVMVVNINHRVGILGFANTGDSIMSGNYALKDQRMALHWIKDNIAYFGGDPNNILLMGFSSGAASVHFQLMHEDLKDVVKGVWSVSGSAVNPWAVQPSGINDAYKLAQLVGCGVPPNNAALKRCLKSVDAIELVNHFPKFLVYDYVPFAPFTPVVESIYAIDPFITKYPADIIKSGKTAQVPWLASYAPEDGIYDAALLLSRLPNGKERIGDLNLRWNELAPYFFAYQNTMNKTARDERSKEIKEKYIGKQRFSLDNYWQVQRMFTNEIFKNGIEKAVDLHRTYGKSPVYSYIYDNPADHSFGQLLAGRNDIFLGTGHGDDWFLMFSNTIREPLRADEKIVSWKLVKMVEDFLQDGHFVYDNCVFQDNVGQDQFQVVAIRRTTCDLLQSDNLPDTVSNNLPESPIVIYT